MSNKKFQKIVVYTMIVIMLISTIAMGVAVDYAKMGASSIRLFLFILNPFK